MAWHLECYVANLPVTIVNLAYTCVCEIRFPGCHASQSYVPDLTRAPRLIKAHTVTLTMTVAAIIY